ncbi:unnamed protein product [Rotaria sordida]|uniref:Uncharacterized protein n=1 Tax=Rotaria sordida TaxID=392033 RepID=A0A815IAT3_9BILA|nr:unnamed protein product [Rotaria sordida]
MTVLSSDSETSDNELQRPRRGNTIDMQDSNYEGSNLNNTVVSNMINEINELTDQNIQNLYKREENLMIYTHGSN